MYTYDRYSEVDETPTAKQRSVYLCMEVKNNIGETLYSGVQRSKIFRMLEENQKSVKVKYRLLQKLKDVQYKCLSEILNINSLFSFTI